METYNEVQKTPMELVWPAAKYLPSYTAALERGWSPDNLRGDAAALEELQKIRQSPEAFLRSLVDLKAEGGPITLPDGSLVKRLPGYCQWLWDGEFCGSIGFRWQPGTDELPAHCLGHIGYAVVSWKRRRGYATRALAALLPAARAQGLSCVQITTSPDNIASQKVIEANGGILHARFNSGAIYGNTLKLCYHVDLNAGTSAAGLPFNQGSGRGR